MFCLCFWKKKVQWNKIIDRCCYKINNRRIESHQCRWHRILQIITIKWLQNETTCFIHITHSDSLWLIESKMSFQFDLEHVGCWCVWLFSIYVFIQNCGLNGLICNDDLSTLWLIQFIHGGFLCAKRKLRCRRGKRISWDIGTIQFSTTIDVCAHWKIIVDLETNGIIFRWANTPKKKVNKWHIKSNDSFRILIIDQYRLQPHHKTYVFCIK